MDSLGAVAAGFVFFGLFEYAGSSGGGFVSEIPIQICW